MRLVSVATPVTPAYRARGSRGADCSEADKLSDFTTKKALVAVAARAKGGWMRGCLPSRGFRRTGGEKSLRAGQLSSHQIVDGPAVDALAGELGHRGFHDAAHILHRGRARLRNRLGDRLVDRRRIGSRGE